MSSDERSHMLNAPFQTGATLASLPADAQAWLASWQQDYLFYQIDANELLTFIAPSVKGILGYDPEEMLGRSYREFLDLDHPLHAQLQDLSDRLLGGGARGVGYV